MTNYVQCICSGLKAPVVNAALSPASTACKCRRQCKLRANFSIHDVLNVRAAYYRQPSEEAATRYLAEVIRAGTPAAALDHQRENFALPPPPEPQPAGALAPPQDAIVQAADLVPDIEGALVAAHRRPRTSFVYKILGKEVCSGYFMNIYGVFSKKLQRVRDLLRLGPEGRLPDLRRSRPRRMPVKYNQAWAFWNQFFARCSQRPNDHTRIFPVNKSMNDIFDNYFKRWFAKVYGRGASPVLPSFATFCRVRHDPAFADVKHRARHFHARCATCANLQARRLQGFKDGHEEASFVRERELHDTAVEGWRKKEMLETTKARHNPREQNTFFFDDTQALGLPRFTKRTPKNLTTSRFNVIPFVIMDEARGRDAYIYTAKNRFKKGANRLCTELFFQILAIKTGDHDARMARRCVFIADNFSENRNNTNLCWSSELVLQNWYDAIEWIFGPVGHTHNGGDQQHQIHNEVCGNLTSPTLAHFVAQFPQAWREPSTRPTASILDVQYDWVKYFAPVMDSLAGFTKTAGDPASVRGFRIAKGASGLVEVRYKKDPCAEHWLGVDGTPASAGFVVLTGRPQGIPAVVAPLKNVMEEKYYKQLTGAAMQSHLEAEGAPGAMAWLEEAALHGVIPVSRELEEETPPGEWGPLVELECDGVRAEVRVIRAREASTKAEFWKIPEVLVEAVAADAEAVQQVEVAAAAGPAVGYRRVSRKKRPTYARSHARLLEQSNDNDAAGGAGGAANARPRRRKRARLIVSDSGEDSAHADPSSGSDSDSASGEELVPARRVARRRVCSSRQAVTDPVQLKVHVHFSCLPQRIPLTANLVAGGVVCLHCLRVRHRRRGPDCSGAAGNQGTLA